MKENFRRWDSMGDKLVEIIDVVSEKAGTSGRMNLAQKTGITRNKASNIEDTPENVSKLKDEASSIIGESIDKYLRKW
jgi:hypothetical protein